MTAVIPESLNIPDATEGNEDPCKLVSKGFILNVDRCLDHEHYIDIHSFGTYELQVDTNATIHVNRNYSLATDGNAVFSVRGNATATVQGGATVAVTRDVAVDVVDGNVTATVAGDINVSSSGTLTIRSQGDMVINGGVVYLHNAQVFVNNRWQSLTDMLNYIDNWISSRSQ